MTDGAKIFFIIQFIFIVIVVLGVGISVASFIYYLWDDSEIAGKLSVSSFLITLFVAFLALIHCIIG